jgi:zinc D-Ala-D-Ala carboxypeptidase
MKLTKHFSRKELACKCCGKLPTETGVITPEKYDAFLSSLEALREAWGKPLPITSGYRCEDHNEAVRGSQSSYHLIGIAVDVSINGHEAIKLANLAIQMGWKGIGLNLKGSIHNRFIHLDQRPNEVGFTY